MMTSGGNKEMRGVSPCVAGFAVLVGLRFVDKLY